MESNALVKSTDKCTFSRFLARFHVRIRRYGLISRKPVLIHNFWSNTIDEKGIIKGYHKNLRSDDSGSSVVLGDSEVTFLQKEDDKAFRSFLGCVLLIKSKVGDHSRG